MGSLSGLKLVEVTANFLRGDAFAKPVSAFVERECLVFDTPSSGAAGGDSGEGYEHALMDVQVAYAKLVSDLLEKHLSGVGAGWDKLQAACLNHQRAPATSVVRNALSCCSDFAAFFDLMAEANLELEARALELWHMQTQFGFDDDDLAAEAELGDSIAPLPSNETLRRDYGLSEATVRELEAARAELGGGEGLVAKLGSLMSALDDEPDPLAAALAAAEPPPVAPSLLTRRGSGARGVPAIALDAPRPSASAPPTTNSAMAQHDAPAIHVTATESLTTAAARAARAAATAAAGAPPKSLHVSGPPSPTQEQSPTSSTVGLERPALSAKPRHVPALKTAGPLSAPAKQSHVRRPKAPRACASPRALPLARGALGRVFVCPYTISHLTGRLSCPLAAGLRARPDRLPSRLASRNRAIRTTMRTRRSQSVTAGGRSAGRSGAARRRASSSLSTWSCTAPSPSSRCSPGQARAAQSRRPCGSLSARLR